MLKDALRSLKRTPGFVLVVTLTLGLGIGTSVTTFTVLQGVSVEAAPISERGAARPSRRRMERQPAPRREAARNSRTSRSNSRTLDAIAVVSGVPRESQYQRRARTRVRGERERRTHLTLLGADPPALGRLFDERTDFAPDGFVSAVVISDALWRRHFGADPGRGRPPHSGQQHPRADRRRAAAGAARVPARRDQRGGRRRRVVSRTA